MKRVVVVCGVGWISLRW